METHRYLGINYYTGSISKYTDGGLLHHEKVNQGYQKTDIGWNVIPEGFYEVLVYIKDLYGNVFIYITENGSCYNDEPVNDQVKDEGRIAYLRQHLTALRRAMYSGVNIKGYMTGSLLDNFEWSEGYSMRFGIVFVNYRTLERTKKDSFYWYKQTVQNNFLKI